jgi:hypothetical protein
MLFTMLACTILAIVANAQSSGILIDAASGTQIYNPLTLPHNVGNLNYGLKHNYGATIQYAGRAYFIGGALSPSNQVNIFNATINTITPGTSLNQPRFQHAATVIDNTIIVCGGELKTSS